MKVFGRRISLPDFNWKRLGVAVAGAAVVGLAAAIPVSATVTIPVLGAIGLKAGIVAVSTYLFGTATRTPGFERTPKPPESIEDAVSQAYQGQPTL